MAALRRNASRSAPPRTLRRAKPVRRSALGIAGLCCSRAGSGQSDAESGGRRRAACDARVLAAAADCTPAAAPAHRHFETRGRSGEMQAQRAQKQAPAHRGTVQLPTPCRVARRRLRAANAVERESSGSPSPKQQGQQLEDPEQRFRRCVGLGGAYDATITSSSNCVRSVWRWWAAMCALPTQMRPISPRSQIRARLRSPLLAG